ncbi:tetratricopeptide repeat protein [Verrucomicrobium spinosum]|uniref:tetratricopeptide repeat protein n=2 Tax=Verrucomicrobium spinosum TaxID=2736 RepID=UPI000174436C|nr:tetratricopeptide repeat protein [Verrucomicrobium spinosum]
MKAPALVRSTGLVIASLAMGVGMGSTGFQATALGQAVPRAVPVAEPAAPRAIPVETPQAPPRATPAVDPGRVPGPDEDLYDYATLTYNQQDYKLAIKPYTDYVTTYPLGRHGAEAWFRLGECYYKTKQNDDAKRCYNEVLTRFPRTDSAGLAAYRMGMFSYNAKDYAKGATYFEIAEKLGTNVDFKLGSVFNKALCYKYSNQKEKALTAFKVVAGVKGGDLQNREFALQEVALGSTELGKKEDAIAAYLEIIGDAKDDKVLGDALIRSGLLYNETNKPAQALKNFERSLALKDLPSDKKGIAVYGLIQGNYVKGDYDGAIDTYTKNATVVAPEDLQGKMLLIVGNAYKNKQMYRQAVDTFLVIEKNHPDTKEALEAGYQKLVCFFQLNDKDMPTFAERFEERYAAKFPGHEYLLMSRLIRADWWFSKAEYVQAAAAFAGLDVSKVPNKVRATVIYKKGFAEAEAGKYTDAVNTLTMFIQEFPKDANLPVALAQRGIAFKGIPSFDKALADFTVIIKDFRGHPALEMAYYQSGDIKSRLRDLPGMIADFETLVKTFPATPAAAECWYRIGRGYFDLKTREGYGKALEPLRKAIELDPKKYLDEASQLLISCQTLREDVDGVSKEIDKYFEARETASVSPAILAWLGERYFKRDNFKAAAKYLVKATTPDNPSGTQGIVWNYLGMAELENGNYDASIRALDFYLAQTPEGASRAKALLTKGHALLGKKSLDEADACAIEGLQIMKEGRLHAQLQLLQGDVFMARGEVAAPTGDLDGAKAAWQKAAGNYVVVSQVFVDPEITPEAAHKAADALDKLGQKDKANSLREQIKTKYPNFVPKGRIKDKEV